MTKTMKGLSKSRYTQFKQCPKALWLRIYKPEMAVVDEALQARFEKGNEVGDLAMGLLGDFKEVTAFKEDGSLDLQTMIALTGQYMSEGVTNICEASFSCQGGYCAVDILHKTEGGWAIYEVKSTSFPMFNEKPAKLEKYAPDIAYQKWVLSQCGINVTGTYLVCLNSDYVREGPLDIQQLFVIKDMQTLVENEYPKVAPLVSQALKVINDETEPDIDLSRRCDKPYPCAFFNYCKEQHGVPSPSVFDVYGGAFGCKKEDSFYITQKLKLYQEGKHSFEDIKDEPLGHIQRLQVEGKEYIDKHGICEFLSTLSYPLYFLDFETMQHPIPQFDRAKPYQQIPFQYSLHIKEMPDTVVERITDSGRCLKFTKRMAPIHREFLAPNDGSDPRRTLAEQLCRDIPMDVCVLAYNKKFEKNRIEELAILYPDLATHLLNIAGNIKDLLDPFQAGYYYLPAMGGSFSIKSVLPALFPDDPDLDYHNLEGSVHNGGEAMTIFPKIKDMQPDEAQAARKALLEYCKLDTWAMVKVWEKLLEAESNYM